MLYLFIYLLFFFKQIAKYTGIVTIIGFIYLKYALTGDKKQNASVKSIGIENIKFVYLFLYKV